ncbi:cupin domain-containing protein, partial [Coprococcus eutactus]|nr:cupin domain-containing protein [Coprococcus eutactus]
VGTMEYDDTMEILNPGGCHYCPPGHRQSLKNNGDDDLVFYAVVPEHN